MRRAAAGLLNRAASEGGPLFALVCLLRLRSSQCTHRSPGPRGHGGGRSWDTAVTRISVCGHIALYCMYHGSLVKIRYELIPVSAPLSEQTLLFVFFSPLPLLCFGTEPLDGEGRGGARIRQTDRQTSRGYLHVRAVRWSFPRRRDLRVQLQEIAGCFFCRF